MGAQEPSFGVVIPHQAVAWPSSLTELHRGKTNANNENRKDEKQHAGSPVVVLRCRENTDGAEFVAWLATSFEAACVPNR